MRRTRWMSCLGILVALTISARASTVLVEAESFKDPGGWVLDTQFIHSMGSPYLMAHGLGDPVKDATTTVKFPAAGTYHVFVRTLDWVAKYNAPGTPGKFQVLIDGQPLQEGYVHFAADPPGHADDFLSGLRLVATRDAWGPRQVPPGELFVMGDNRDNSRDSRYWGFLPVDQVRGRALLVYWSYDAAAVSGSADAGAGPARWLHGRLAAIGRTRWERVFHLMR